MRQSFRPCNPNFSHRKGLCIGQLSFILSYLSFVHSMKSFHSDYNNNTDLHIAVTTSTGIIVEFDSHGLRQHSLNDSRSPWEQSLVVESIPEAWWDFWDEILFKVRFQLGLNFSLINFLFNFRQVICLHGQHHLIKKIRIIVIHSCWRFFKRLVLVIWVAWHLIGYINTIYLQLI